MLDFDKLVYVQLATDDWEGSTGQIRPARWDVSRLWEDLNQRNTNVKEHLKTSGIDPDRILTLTLMQSTGRWFTIGYTDLSQQNLAIMMPATSFKPMAMLDSADPLWLWKFARANTNLLNRRRVLVFDPLDEYSIFRAQGHGFLISEQPVTDEICFYPGAGLGIREQVREQLDPHGVAAFVEGYVIEVWAVSDMGAPVYATPMLVGAQRPFVIEGELPIPIWVTGQETIDQRLIWIQQELLEMVAFWIWQFESVISRSIGGLVGTLNAFTVELVLDYPPAWVSIVETSLLEEGPLISRIDPTQSGMRIAIDSRFLTKIDGPTNEGEREFVRELLLGLGEILSTRYSLHAKEMAASSINDFLDTFAPLGSKKKLVLTTSEPVIYHDFLDLPSFRSVQDADRNEILESVVEHATIGLAENADSQLAEGRKESADRVVSFLYRELAQLVSTFDAMDLVSRLIAYNESNTQRRTQSDLTVPTRIACYGRRDEVVRNLLKETASIDTASLANRFLIEYIASNPPLGSEQLSLSDYDRLLALAHEIICFGTISDNVHFGLEENTGATFLRSRRLALVQQTNQLSVANFMSKLTSDNVVLLERAFDDHWTKDSERSDADDDAPLPIQEIDAAFSDEFCITLTELVEFLHHILNIGLMEKHPTKMMMRQDLIESMCLSCGWNEEKVIIGLNLLSLCPRDDFFNPPGESRSAVYPWRQNRPWSFLRRPLVATGDEPDSLIMWGSRHIISAVRYIAKSCSSGRINARTNRLKQVLGRIRETKAKEFEDAVGRLVTELTGIQSKVRVKKIRGRKIKAHGKDLGDIDVLGVIPNQQVILCIECKALALARTPAEVHYQLEELFIGSESRTSTIQKHIRRARWVEDNLYQTLEFLEIEHQSRRWKVKPVLVSDSEIFASYLTDTPIPVWSIETLRGMTIRDIALLRHD